MALSFFQFFLYALISKKDSGHYLALAILTRYNFLMFVPFLFFSKSIKKISKNVLLFTIVLFPWFLYNFLKFGNWFTSIADSFYLNILSRQEMVQAFSFLPLLHVTNFLLPFFILGLFVFFKKLKKKKFALLKYDFLFLIILIFLFVGILSTPFKVERYFFNFVLPVAYFSVLGVVFLIDKFRKKDFFMKFLRVIFLVFFAVVFFVMLSHAYNVGKTDDAFLNASKDIQRIGLSECKVVSPHWVPVNYYSGNVYYLSSIKSSLNRNETVLIFYNDPTYDDSFTKKDLEKYKPLIKTNDYLIISSENMTNETCAKNLGHSSPFVKDSCRVLSSEFKKVGLDKIFLKICKVINFA